MKPSLLEIGGKWGRGLREGAHSVIKICLLFRGKRFACKLGNTSLFPKQKEQKI